MEIFTRLSDSFCLLYDIMYVSKTVVRKNYCLYKNMYTVLFIRQMCVYVCIYKYFT